jgi:hypothetical protein
MSHAIIRDPRPATSTLIVTASGVTVRSDLLTNFTPRPRRGT